MFDAVTEQEARLDQCCNCRAWLGPSHKVSPMLVDEGDPKSATSNTRRAWCPTCFVFKRASLEPGRWTAIAPVQCANCGWLTVLFGFSPKEAPRCTRCNSPRVRIPLLAQVVDKLLAKS